LNDESRESYQDLREEIICVSDAMDDDCMRHYDLYLGVHVESTFPEELDDIDRGENDLGEKAQDFIDGLLAYEKLIIAFTGNVLFEIDSFRQETLDRAEKLIRSNNEEIAMYIGSMKKDTEQTVFSLAINTIATDLDFSYIEQAQLKELFRLSI
jgi:hypothetical protein